MHSLRRLFDRLRRRLVESQPYQALLDPVCAFTYATLYLLLATILIVLAAVTVTQHAEDLSTWR